MKKIPLTQGKCALVDDADYPLVSKHKWYAARDDRTFYARRNVLGRDGRSHTISMHRFILGLKPGERGPDHKNRNGLDNRRQNLRFCTASQSGMNRAGRQGSSSLFKGVGWHRTHAKWQARIQIHGNITHLGYFEKERDAAIAYDSAAKRIHREFAVLIFPTAHRAQRILEPSDRKRRSWTQLDMPSPRPSLEVRKCNCRISVRGSWWM